MKPLIEQELGVQVLGYVPKLMDLNLESRHLGLVLPGEIEALKEKLKHLAMALEETLDLDELLRLAEMTEPINYEEPKLPVLEQDVYKRQGQRRRIDDGTGKRTEAEDGRNHTD